MRIIPAVLEQHAEDAAFLWMLRDAAATAPHYSTQDLAALDLRLEAHLDGLRIAGPHGWSVLRKSLDLEGPGEVFAAAVLAFESGDAKRTELVLDAGAASPELSRGLVSAIGWLPPKKADRLIKILLVSPSKLRRRIGVAGAAVRRLDFEKAFVDAVHDDDPLLKARSIRALAELGMKRHAPLLERHLGAADPAVGFAAAWGCSLLTGAADAVASLQAFAAGRLKKSADAVVLAARRSTVAAADAWREKLASSPATLRQAVIAAGAAGDPAAVPWLLDRMGDPAQSRVAGEALSMITGVDLAHEDLDTACPEGAAGGPDDDPDHEEVDPGPDENLPWPDVPRLRAWWAARKSHFAPGKRHLGGRAITDDSLRGILKDGRQRQRAAAALELAILEPGAPLVEVRAPAFRG